MTTTIRRAGPADAPAVQCLLLELADHEDSAHAVRVSTERWAALLADERVVVLIAADDEGDLGYVSAVRQLHLWSGEDIVALDDLYVRPRGRNGGVGDDLMTAMAEHATREGRLLIRWEMQDDNHGAQRFYRRLGATLRRKVIAAWLPHDYEAHIATRSGAVTR